MVLFLRRDASELGGRMCEVLWLGTDLDLDFGSALYNFVTLSKHNLLSLFCCRKNTCLLSVGEN